MYEYSQEDKCNFPSYLILDACNLKKEKRKNVSTLYNSKTKTKKKRKTRKNELQNLINIIIPLMTYSRSTR